MPDNVLEKIIKKKKEKIESLKETFSLESLKELISSNKTFINFKEKIVNNANSQEIEKQYLENTENARSHKIFGSPSFVVGNEIFWGDDRMEDAINWSKNNE